MEQNKEIGNELTIDCFSQMSESNLVKGRITFSINDSGTNQQLSKEDEREKGRSIIDTAYFFQKLRPTGLKLYKLNLNYKLFNRKS